MTKKLSKHQKTKVLKPKVTVQSSISSLDSLDNLSGPLTYGFTNDYMFRAVFQENKEALHGLLCALLDLSWEQIIQITILNPIILGEAINEKTIVLDLKILLNDNRILDLEMQVANEGDWPERSLYYLCQTFAQLPKGGVYKDLLPAMHIGILSFSPIPENPRFYAEYLMSDIKTHKIYSDKFALRMLDLSKINSLTNEEKQTDLYRWAKLFTATTWEEVKKLANEDSTISKACFTLHEMTEDEKIREQCLARMRYELDRNSAIRNGFDKGFSQGLEAGTEAGKSQLIFTLLESGMTLDELSVRLKMPVDEIQKLTSSTPSK